MRAALHRANTVHERALLKLRALGDGDAHFPSIHGLFKNLRRVGLAVQVQAHVIVEALDFELFTVQEDVRVLTDVTGRIVHALAHQRRHILVHERFHAKLGEIRLECDARPVFALLALGELRLALHAHVVVENLTVSLPARAIARLDDEFCGENVGQLGAVTVSPADNLLLVVVVVARRQQVTKDEFRHVHALVLVNLDRNTVTVVEHSNHPLLDVDVHSQLFHLRVAHLVIGGVYENLIENLVQTRHERHLLVHQRLGRDVVHPRLFLGSLARPHVRVRSK